MTTPPRQPEQVEMDLTTRESGEAVPTERADPQISTGAVSTSLSVKLQVARLLEMEAGLHEAESNEQTAALLHFAIIMLVVAVITSLVHRLSKDMDLSLVCGTFTLVAGVFFVRTAPRRKP
jgi:uncharacterized membrane protein HdeD (DUF308 family)